MLAGTRVARFSHGKDAWSGAGRWVLSLVVCACLGWAIDNSLTQKVSAIDPVQIAAKKGAGRR
jgi:hypothetical protein